MNPKTPANDTSAVVVMGVSGSGKSTIASMLAQRLHWIYEDGDWFHPQSNIEKMHHGEPLNDEDRWPWLNAIAAWIDEERAKATPAIVTCSALKRSYRSIIIGDRPDVRLVFLQGGKELLVHRLKARHGHFMPPALLDSQFADLEPPGSDENPITVSVDATPDEIVTHIVEKL